MSRLRDYSMQKFRKHPSDVSPEELELTQVETAGDDPLTASLHNLLPEDIDLKKQTAAKKKKSGGAIARRVVLIFSVAVFAVCAVYLVWNLVDKQRGKEFYENMANEFDIDFDDNDEGDGAVARLGSLKGAQRILCLKDRLAAGDSSGDITYNSDLDEMRAKLVAMSETYPDLYGWLYVEGTTINYALVQGSDNNHYLNFGPNNEPMVNGSIFVDYRNNKEIMRNFNTVIYGHNLTGGGMFHDVETRFVRDEETFRNSYIYIYTMDGAYVYEPFAVYETLATYQYFRTEFASTDEFVAFANEMHGNSLYEKEMEFSPTDRIITFSTCTNRSIDGRYTLQAKLVQVIH